MFKVALFSLFLSLNVSANIKLVSVYDESVLGDVISTFTKETGIQVELIAGKAGELLELSSGADLLLNKDVTYLNDAQRAKAFQKLNHTQFEVPAKFFSTQKDWMLIFYRTRTLVYNKNLVSPEGLSSYFDLGKKEFKGRVCMRVASSSYNKAWTGYLLSHFSAENVYQFLGKLSENAYRPLFTSDRDMIRAVSKGECLVGLVNSYYLPGFIKEDPNFPVGLRFVEQDGVGSHINGIGMGVFKSSQNKEEAIKFIQFMTSLKVQNLVGQAFEQYPVHPEAQWSKTLQGFGPFKIDTSSLSDAGFFQELGLQMMTEQGL